MFVEGTGHESATPTSTPNKKFLDETLPSKTMYLVTVIIDTFHQTLRDLIGDGELEDFEVETASAKRDQAAEEKKRKLEEDMRRELDERKRKKMELLKKEKEVEMVTLIF